MVDSINRLDGRRFDVVIIGAGVAGSLAAILCARAGLETLLLDRQRFPRSKVCGCCLNGRALQLLRRAGLEPRLNELGPCRTSRLAIRYSTHRLDLPLPEGWAVSREALDASLVREAVAAGCQFRDNVTATVTPYPWEVDRGANPAVPTRQQAKSDRSLPEDRCILLRPSAVERTERAATQDSSPLQPTRASIRTLARVVLACDGLAHPSLQRLAGFHDQARAGSRIGMGAVFPRSRADDWLRPGEILMAIAPFGYAGLVEIENQRLNLAAAIDPNQLRRTKSPTETLVTLFRAAGLPVPQGLPESSLKGTVKLTRTSARVASHRLLLLGDSTGYVEPFSGEGMAWALAAAAASLPLVVSGVREGWSETLIRRWENVLDAVVRREQRTCRLLTAAMHHTWLLPPLISFCRVFPSVSRNLIVRINRLPSALEPCP